MSLETDIQSALCDHLSSPALSGSPTIVMPLVKFAPTPGTSYVEARPVLRAEPDQPGLAFDAMIFRRGIFQVDAVTPDQQGEAPGLRLAALVADRFAIGTELTAGSRKLQVIGEPVIAAAVKDAPWVRFPVSIPYLVIA